VKRLLLVTCLVAATLVAAAGAQDSNFSGFYVGANIGGAFGTADARTTPAGVGNYFADTSVPAIAATGHQELKSNGIVGGGTFGYNWHNDDGLFLGLEADMGAMRLEDSAVNSAEYPCCAPDTFTVGQSINTDWLVTVRPRLGYTKKNWLVFVTGGLAMTNLNYHADFTDTFGPATESGGVEDLKLGWTVGGGAEFAIPNTHWSVKGEYLYVVFGDETNTSTNFFDGAALDPGTPFTHTTDLKAHVVRFGINYRF